MVDFEWLDKLVKTLNLKEFIKEENIKKTVITIDDLLLGGFLGSCDLSSEPKPKTRYRGGPIEDMLKYIEQMNEEKKEMSKKRKYSGGMVYELQKYKKGLERQGFATDGKVFENYFRIVNYYINALEKIHFLCEKAHELYKYKIECEAYLFVFMQLDKGNPKKKKRKGRGC